MIASSALARLASRAVAARSYQRGRIYQGHVDTASVRIWLRNPVA